MLLFDEIWPGDVVWIPAGQKHWHGASPTAGMSHIAIGEQLDGRGDLVVAPFAWSDGTCEFCRQGIQTSCLHGGFWGGELDGGQGEAVRVPLADGTLVKLPVGPDDALMPGLLTLSDVLGTGHHAAKAAKVGPGKIVAVVGDGAVGLCGVIAARRLGAEQIILLGRHPDRIALARDFGATEIVSERGEAAIEKVRQLTGGQGRIQPGRVFDRVTDLDGVPDGYRQMNDREAIKVMIDFP
jgi:threonine dehydrogenase-like Zn-dependent dehydrogenase